MLAQPCNSSKQGSLFYGQDIYWKSNAYLVNSMLKSTGMDTIYSLASECEKNNRSAALVCIVTSEGSTPRKAGSKMLVYANGNTEGTIGGGAMEQSMKEYALKALEHGRPVFHEHLLHSDHNMACSGKVQIYIEPIGQRFELFIFGAGHIGQKLANLANDLNFSVTVIDERKELCDEIASTAIRIICKNYKNSFDDLKFTNRSLIASMSHLHEYDRDIVAFCAKQPHLYLGMIGSERKIAKVRKFYKEKNLLTEIEMDAIDWPMGIPISCQTPEEIVVSVLAKIIDVRGKQINGT